MSEGEKPINGDEPKRHLNAGLGRLAFKSLLVAVTLLLTIIGVNKQIDCSNLLPNPATYNQMAKMCLAGDVVATPANYNERTYQVSVADMMRDVPSVLVVGSSRGMFLGKELPGLTGVYNCCVSGAELEDYYALVGMYESAGLLPDTVVLEVSPWILFEKGTDNRWMENASYRSYAEDSWLFINRETLPFDCFGSSRLSKALDYSYFRENIDYLLEKGPAALEGFNPHVSIVADEQAELPDGTIRYAAERENASEERTEKVKAGSKGPVTYKGLQNMTQVDEGRAEKLEHLVDHLIGRGCEVVFFLAPFSATQSEQIYSNGTNPGFPVAEKCVRDIASERSCRVVGSYDAAQFSFDDTNFVDFMHPDRKAVAVVWSSER